MKTNLILLATTFLLGCTAEPIPQPASAQAKADANRQYLLCERSAITRLDDGISDARTVASAVFAACSTEAYASAEIYAASLTIGAGQGLMAQVPNTYRQIALEGVLTRRAAKK